MTRGGRNLRIDCLNLQYELARSLMRCQTHDLENILRVNLFVAAPHLHQTTQKLAVQKASVTAKTSSSKTIEEPKHL